MRDGRHRTARLSAAVQVSYHLYVGHGLAAEYFRKQGYEGEIGITPESYGKASADRQRRGQGGGCQGGRIPEPLVCWNPLCLEDILRTWLNFTDPRESACLSLKKSI